MSSMNASPSTPSAYPARLSIDYPDRPLNRLTSFFRAFTAIPIAIILWLLNGAVFNGSDGKGGDLGLTSMSGANFKWTEQASPGWDWGSFASVGIIVLPLVLMILFRKKYPKWWYDWNLALTKFSTRVSSYFFLLRDEYPSTDEEQAVHIEMPYPDAQKLMRGMPLVKWILAIPHYVVLVFLAIAVFVCLVISWFAILFTGRYPKGLFDFVVGFMRWCFRVEAYAVLLVTDQYPPFSLSA